MKTKRSFLGLALALALSVAGGCSSQPAPAPAPSLEAQIKNIESNATLPAAAKTKMIADLRAKSAATPAP